MKTKLLFNFFVIGGCFGACESSTTTQDLSYSFTFNGCETGEHSFSSLQELCEGLQDEDLNNSCARSLREEYFESQNCTGDFY